MVHTRKHHFMNTQLLKLIMLSLLAAVLYGCDSAGNDEVIRVVEVPQVPAEPVTLEYEVSVLNLTGGQPLSPITVVIHDMSSLLSR